ncbi:MAG TPA: hypothetical protein VF676_00980 [Flavobacterium sp.]|jgi:hypothetical protein
MKSTSLSKLLLAFSLLLVVGSCKEPNGEAQDVGSGAGNGDMYSDPGSGETEDHPGQNIGSDNDSTTVHGEKGNPSNH